MTTKFFYQSYDKDELEIKGLRFISNTLEIVLEVTAHLELIANGYRPELDVKQVLRFKFHDVSAVELEKPYTLDQIEYTDHLVLTINNTEIHIQNEMCDVEVVC